MASESQFTALLQQAFANNGSNPFSGQEVFDLLSNLNATKTAKDTPVTFNSGGGPVDFLAPYTVHIGYANALSFNLTGTIVPGAVAMIEYTVGTDPTSLFPVGVAEFKSFNFIVSATNWIKIEYLSVDRWIVSTPYNPGSASGSTVSISNDQQTTGSFTLTINSTPETVLNNLGTFSGTTISNNTNLKNALQQLETALEAIAGGGSVVTVQDQIATLGTFTITIDSVPTQFLDDLGTYTGTTIPDNVNIRTALQSLETAIEGIVVGDTVSVQDNGPTNGTIVLTINATPETLLDDLGTFTGSTITDNITLKAVLQELESAIEAISGDDLGNHEATQDLNLNGNNLIGGLNGTFTGSITLGGTIDGRDPSVDGAKLDGIETTISSPATNADVELDRKYLGKRTSDPDNPISDSVLTVNEGLVQDGGVHEIWHLSTTIPSVVSATLQIRDYGLRQNYVRGSLNIIVIKRVGTVITINCSPQTEPSGTGGGGTAISGNADLILGIRASDDTNPDQTDITLVQDISSNDNDMSNAGASVAPKLDASKISYDFDNAKNGYLANTSTGLTGTQYCVICVFTPRDNMANADGIWGSDDASGRAFLSWRIDTDNYIRFFNGTNFSHTAAHPNAGIPVTKGQKTMFTVNCRASDVVDIHVDGAAAASPTWTGTLASPTGMNGKAVVAGILDSGSSFFSDMDLFDFYIFQNDQNANIDAMQAEMLAKHPDIGS